MKKYIYLLLLGAIAALPFTGKADMALPGQWRIHNTLDRYFQETIDTPTRVYLLALGQKKDAAKDSWKQTNGQLFVLDKNSGELTGYNKGNYLNGNVITDIAYNPAKKYLVIVYDDFTIDILHDNGDKVYSIPGLASSSLTASKNINNITFDPEKNRAYLATDFGYIVIDDKKYVISESRIYGEKFNGIGRVGDYLIAGTPAGLYIANAADRNSSFDSFRKVPVSNGAVSFIMPLTDKTFGVKDEKGLSVGTIAEDGQIELNLLDSSNLQYFTDNRDGYFLRRSGCAYQLGRDGKIQKYIRTRLVTVPLLLPHGMPRNSSSRQNVKDSCR